MEIGEQGIDAVVARYRSLLFSIAYRMTGSVMDAEDLVQETFLRWQQADHAAIASPKAFLTTVVTRLCIDYLRSARVQREEYMGPWLPEPLVTAAADTTESVEAVDSLSLAFLVLLESLTPVERAVFLLHDVFAYPFDEVARIVGKSEANCRQIAGRARRHVQERRPRFEPSPTERERLTERFMQACTTGDMASLLAVLADDITLWTDGGGRTQAARRPVHGAVNVAHFLLTIMGKVPAGMTFRLARVNGQPGLISETADGVNSATALDIVDGRIQAIRIVVNPDKLQGLTHP